MADRGGKPLSSVSIYDALWDDEAFASLPSQLAQSVGARSTTIGWHHIDGGTSVLAHSNYYSEEQLANYATNYAEADVWVMAALPADRRNIVWNLDDLVEDKQYRTSRFFNDWIRGMGDDTYHCLGASVVGTHGAGIIGLHRGHGAERFDGGEVERLRSMMPGLSRMLSVRGRLQSATRSASKIASMLDAVNMVILGLTETGKLLHANKHGEAFLKRGDMLCMVRGAVRESGGYDASLRIALLQATCPTSPSAATVLLRNEVGERLIATVVPHRSPEGRRHAMLLAPAKTVTGSLSERLRDAFQLTRAEAEIAIMIADGEDQQRISDLRSVSVETVRTQVKNILGKMGCNRQAKIAALVIRMDLATGVEPLSR